MRLIATIESRGVIQRILTHLGHPAARPLPWPAGAPLEPHEFEWPRADWRTK